MDHFVEVLCSNDWSFLIIPAWKMHGGLLFLLKCLWWYFALSSRNIYQKANNHPVRRSNFESQRDRLILIESLLYICIKIPLILFLVKHWDNPCNWLVLLIDLISWETEPMVLYRRWPIVLVLIIWVKDCVFSWRGSADASSSCVTSITRERWQIEKWNNYENSRESY